MKRNRIIIYLLIFIEITIIISFLFKTVEQVLVTNEQSDFPVGDIYQGNTVIQSVKIKQSGIQKLELKLATYARVNTSNLIISIYKNDNLINKVILDPKQIIDNEFFKMELEKNELKKDDIVKIIVSSENGNIGNAFTIWASNDDRFEGELKVNDQSLDGDLNLRLIQNIYKYEQLFTMLNKLPIGSLLSLSIICVLFLSFNLVIYSLLTRYLKY